MFFRPLLPPPTLDLDLSERKKMETAHLITGTSKWPVHCDTSRYPGAPSTRPRTPPSIGGGGIGGIGEGAAAEALGGGVRGTATLPPSRRRRRRLEDFVAFDDDARLLPPASEDEARNDSDVLGPERHAPMIISFYRSKPSREEGDRSSRARRRGLIQSPRGLNACRLRPERRDATPFSKSVAPPKYFSLSLANSLRRSPSETGSKRCDRTRTRAEKRRAAFPAEGSTGCGEASLSLFCRRGASKEKKKKKSKCAFPSSWPRFTGSLSLPLVEKGRDFRGALCPHGGLPLQIEIMPPREAGGGGAASTSGRPSSSHHARSASGGSSNASGAATGATMANPLSRGHSLLADYLDASGAVPLPISEVHMNAPVPTREHVGE